MTQKDIEYQNLLNKYEKWINNQSYADINFNKYSQARIEFYDWCARLMEAYRETTEYRQYIDDTINSFATVDNFGKI